ncbi:hypothetical protein BS78_04G153600 [Paspalum vaginatum]|nr:hypothetical protein BS78_04G153600 [Paspalum vaginatum]
MSRGSRGGRGLDLKLHLSPPAPAERGASSDEEEWSSSTPPSSPPSSCLSSEGERDQHQGHGLQWSDSPGATPMVLAACPRCLMYVMLSEADPRCPRCRSPVLLDFLHHAAVPRSSSRAINVDAGRDGGGGRNRRV